MWIAGTTDNVIMASGRLGVIIVWLAWATDNEAAHYSWNFRGHFRIVPNLGNDLIRS